MCLLHCNATADESLQELRKAGYTKVEAQLAKLAADDTIEQRNGLGLLFQPVDDWAKLETLREVRKYRSDRHRFYFVGSHKDCNYHLRFVLPFKRDEDDKPKDKRYQNKVLRAMADEDVCRTLEISRPETNEAEED